MVTETQENMVYVLNLIDCLFCYHYRRLVHIEIYFVDWWWCFCILQSMKDRRYQIRIFYRILLRILFNIYNQFALIFRFTIKSQKITYRFIQHQSDIQLGYNNFRRLVYRLVSEISIFSYPLPTSGGGCFNKFRSTFTWHSFSSPLGWIWKAGRYLCSACWSSIGLVCPSFSIALQ